MSRGATYPHLLVKILPHPNLSLIGAFRNLKELMFLSSSGSTSLTKVVRTTSGSLVWTFCSLETYQQCVSLQCSNRLKGLRAIHNGKNVCAPLALGLSSAWPRNKYYSPWEKPRFKVRKFFKGPKLWFLLFSFLWRSTLK